MIFGEQPICNFCDTVIEKMSPHVSKQGGEVLCIRCYFLIAKACGSIGMEPFEALHKVHVETLLHRMNIVIKLDKI